MLAAVTGLPSGVDAPVPGDPAVQLHLNRRRAPGTWTWAPPAPPFTR